MPATDGPKGKTADRVMTVITKASGTVFHRGGLEFSWMPLVVREAEIGTESFERILADPQLRCTIMEA